MNITDIFTDLLWIFISLMLTQEPTNQWSLLRLGGAVQSFRGRRGPPQAPPLIDSDNVLTATADKRIIRADLQEEEEEEQSHMWKAPWLDERLRGGVKSEKCHWPEERGSASDWLQAWSPWDDWRMCKEFWEDKLERQKEEKYEQCMKEKEFLRQAKIIH